VPLAVTKLMAFHRIPRLVISNIASSAPIPLDSAVCTDRRTSKPEDVVFLTLSGWNDDFDVGIPMVPRLVWVVMALSLSTMAVLAVVA